MRNTTALLSLVALIAVAGCSKPPAPASAPANGRGVPQTEAFAKAHAEHEEVLPPKPGAWEGIPIPGRAADAKTAGFSDCYPSGTVSLWCRNPAPDSWLGATPKKASLYLNADDPFDQVVGTPMPELAGKRLEDLSFNAIDLEFSYAETKKFREGLRNAGWLPYPGVPDTFVHFNVPLVVTIHSATLKVETTIRYMPLDTVNEAAIAAGINEASTLTAQDLAEQMKG